MHDQSSSTNSPLLPSNIQNMPISNRRSSSRINPREVSGARRQSGVRRGISKTNVSSSYGRSSKATPQSRRENKKIDIDLDIQTAMDYDVNNVNNSSSPQRDEDEQQNLLNISSASADTTIAATLNHKNRLLTRPIEYFIHANDGEKVKLKDSLSFGTFRRASMQHFLEIIKPGYRGPTRQTVRKNLDEMYQERRSSLKEKLKNIAHISLTTDLWLNSRRNHFIVITAHYLDEYHQHLSDIISFRRFRGRHFSVRLKPFIINEIKKLNIESKIISITTDSGSDIKAATSSYEFGLRFSCDAHNINQKISIGLGLWKVSTSKGVKAQITTTTHAPSNDSDDELEAIRLIDFDLTSDEWVDVNNPDLDDEDYVPIIFDENESDRYSDSSDEYDDDLILSLEGATNPNPSSNTKGLLPNPNLNQDLVHP
ncbi:unnamed protein product [Rotaria socialis]|uniref:Uncharacterized protein n=2 Tax=Rotaria socialis TaxID=392032 RepID=A0A818C308_9BILA|nr:unnamed protein product [Rotaria socialis]